MRKTYETPRYDVDIPSGDVGYVTMPFPASAMIKKLVVVQTAGSDVAFSVEVFNSSEVLPASESVSASLSAAEEALHRVMDKLEAAAGEAIEVYNPNGYCYRNMSPDSSPSNNVREIYLRITPVSAGNTTFSIVIGGEPATAN